MTRTVVIATGATPRPLGIPGEREWTGRGVHYCAACDGMAYRGKTVAVIGGGNSAAEDALTLSRFAKKVYLIHRRDTLRAEKIYTKQLEEKENVEFCWNSTVEKRRKHARKICSCRFICAEIPCLIHGNLSLKQSCRRVSPDAHKDAVA